MVELKEVYFFIKTAAVLSTMLEDPLDIDETNEIVEYTKFVFDLHHGNLTDAEAKVLQQRFNKYEINPK
ncbi:hypothetical protein LCGC14_0195760 [marine sediment metagenome]|uniref:Uncharacterized protein n=1 Tax=marine sediment metagenome TaxID=412755 RepID=A0A0F9XNF7_9ZZZZ